MLSDRTDTIRSSVRDVQHELMFAVALVLSLLTGILAGLYPAGVLCEVVNPDGTIISVIAQGQDITQQIEAELTRARGLADAGS